MIRAVPERFSGRETEGWQSTPFTLLPHVNGESSAKRGLGASSSALVRKTGVCWWYFRGSPIRGASTRTRYLHKLLLVALLDRPTKPPHVNGGGGAQGGKPEACRSQLCWDCHGKIEDFDIAPQRDGRAPPVLLGCEEATMPPKQGRGCPIPPSGYFPTHVGKLSDREAGAMDRQTPVYASIAPFSATRSGGVHAATLRRRIRTDGTAAPLSTHRSA